MSVMIATFAPAARHASACADIFCGSLSAFVIDAEMPAALNAFAKSGASNCTQRTDDLVSGRSTHTWTLAPVLAVAPVASTANAAHATATTRPAAADLRNFPLTPSLLALVNFWPARGLYYST